MKVLLINGSPHAEGCTFTALSEVGEALRGEGVETHVLQIGGQPVRGCIGCGRCAPTKRCIFDDDLANRISDFIHESDGVILGSPVYYAGPNGALCALLDRAFYSAGRGFRGKPGAAVVSCRRAGSTAALDRLNKYFTINSMPVVPSQYWNMVHGNTADEVRQDKEGLQIMRTLGRNMAYMLKAFEQQGPLPKSPEKREMTNFIR